MQKRRSRPYALPLYYSPHSPSPIPLSQRAAHKKKCGQAHHTAKTKERTHVKQVLCQEISKAGVQSILCVVLPDASPLPSDRFPDPLPANALSHKKQCSQAHHAAKTKERTHVKHILCQEMSQTGVPSAGKFHKEGSRRFSTLHFSKESAPFFCTLQFSKESAPAFLYFAIFE